MKKIFTSILVSILFLTPVAYAQETEEITSITINIYVNDSLKAIEIIDEGEYPEITYGTVPIGYLYGDIYGEISRGEVFFNGEQGQYFGFTPDTPSIFTSSWGMPSPEDEIVLNLYYIKEIEDIELELEFGEAKVFVTDGRNPVEGYEIVFTGKRGAETIEVIGVSDAEGNIIVSLDKSYNWTYIFNSEATFAIDEFDYYNQVALPNDVRPDIPDYSEEQEYAVSITHYFCDAPTSLNNNIPSEYTHSAKDDDRLFLGGTIINVNDYVREVENYHLGAVYTRGGGAYDNAALTIADNYIVSIVYIKDPVISPVKPEPTEEEPVAKYYTVTYKDGDTILQVTTDCLEGSETPTYDTTTLIKSGYVFAGWSPEVAPTVTEDAIYEALWNPVSSGRRHHNTTTTPSTPDPVVIEEPEVPLSEEPEVISIDEQEVPLADLPEIEKQEEEEPAETPVTIPDEPSPTTTINHAPLPAQPATPAVTTTIVDEKVPLAQLPQTGDMTKSWALVMFFSGIALVGVGMYGKRKVD